MDVTGKLCELLEKKKEWFLKYEEATLALLSCEPDDAENYIMERGRIANEIDGLTEEIARVCDDQPGKEVLLAAAAAKVNFEHVPSEFHCVFYAGQAVRSVGSRIMESEKQVMARLERLRDEAKENIRQNQNVPKIKKYLTGLTDNIGDGNLTENKA